MPRSSIALLALGWASAACAPSALRGRSIADPLDAPDAVVAIGRAGDLAYAVTRSRKLRTWNLETRELRTLEWAGVVAIARDAAIGLRASGEVIEAWEPGSGRSIARHRFEHGIEAVQGVSPVSVFLVANRPRVHWPANAEAPPPPRTEFVSWELASGKIDALSVRGCDSLGLSVDGAISLCDLGWKDRRSGVETQPPPVAPEWAPPDPEPEGKPPGCPHCQWHEPATGAFVLSTWLSADGRSVYVTYDRTEGGPEWRLDRWIPDATGKTGGRVEHLAASREPIADGVVAASLDGRTVLTNPGVRPPVLRHAPGYEGIPLLAPPVTAAAFSEDDRRIVTGHGDGRLRLWEADSGRFEAVSPE